MNEEEIEARFTGLRIALAFAIKVASRTPADLNHNVATLKEIESLIPPAAHPALKNELRGVLTALTRLPVKDPSADQHSHGVRLLAMEVQAAEDTLTDLLFKRSPISPT